MSERIRVEMTAPDEFHCFRLILQAQGGEQIEIMLHATALVELIHQASTALCAWQQQTTRTLILARTGLSEEDARRAGLIAS